MELGFGYFRSAALRPLLLLALATRVALVPAKQSFQARLALSIAELSHHDCV